MRHFIALGLCLGIVGSAAAQTEVIIRRPGEKDQVIRLDSTHAREALAKAQAELRKVTTAVHERLQTTMNQQHLEQMKLDGRLLNDQMKINGQLLRERMAELPARINTLALKNTGLATRNMIAPMLTELKARLRQPRMGITVDTRARDTDKWGAYVISVTPGSPADKAGILSGDIIMRLAGKSVTEKTAKSEDGDESGPGLRLIEIVSQLEPGKPVDVELRRGTQNRTVKVTPMEDTSPAIARISPDRAPFNGSFSYTLPSRDMVRPAMPEAMTLESPSMSIFTNGMPGSYFYSFGNNGLFANLELVSLNEKLGSYFGTNEGVLVVNNEAHRMFEDVVPFMRGDVVVRKREGDSTTVRLTPRAGVVARSRGDSGEATPPAAARRAAPVNIGLEPGDVIVSVDGRKVTTPSQLMRIVATYDRGDEFKLQIMRQKRAESITVKMP